MGTDESAIPDTAELDDLEGFEELQESECWSLLRSVTVGRLAIPLPHGGVDIFPVNHVVDQGSVVFRTAAGTKLSSIAEVKEVAFEVDNADDPQGVAWSVIVHGHAEVVTSATDLFQTFDLKVKPWHAAHKPYFVRILPHSTTGRRFVVASDTQG